MNWTDFKTLHYPRALLLMALGALTGLLLAAYGLFTAKGTSTLVVPAEDVALVNQQPIMRSDFLTQLRATYDVDISHATPAQKKAVLDDMIREELFVQRGTELDVASADPDVRAAMVSAVEQQTATDAMTSMPGDEKLLAYFNANKGRYSSDGYMVLRDIVFPGKTAGQLAGARALSADAAIARFGGRDTRRVSGAEFYFAAPVHLGAAFAGIAQALPSGGVSQPLTAPDGLHLLYMEKNVPPVPLDFTRAKARILADYRQDAAQRMQEHERTFLRERANVLIADDLK
jgi:parvulin-like peptidyl-prolyl isomerase